MRVLTVLVALMAMPVLVGVAQDRGQSATKAADEGRCAVADDHRSPTSWENSGRPEDKKGRDRVGCSPVAPIAPAPSCGVAPAAGGTSSITGWVEEELVGTTLRRVPAGWCVQLSGAASGSALTDGSGNYGFWNLSSGTYLVCLDVPPTHTQTVPSSGPLCPSGNYGRSFTASNGSSASFMKFRVAPKQLGSG